MKKIIATVLAMVMALALCTTAFAEVDTSGMTKSGMDAYGNDGNQIEENNDFGYKYVAGSTSSKTVAHYIVYHYNTENSYTYGNYYIKATASNYDLKLTKSGSAPLYLTELNNQTAKYENKVVAFTNVGEKCGQLDVDTTGTYYSYTDDNDNVTYYEKDSDAETYVLFNGELVAAKELTGAELNAHNWKAATYASDDSVATYKCKNCGTIATVYKTKEAAEAAGAATVEINANYGVLGYGTTTPADTKTDGTSSPKTFDAGIAMYVGMALTSVAGSAVVIGKKKEF